MIQVIMNTSVDNGYRIIQYQKENEFDIFGKEVVDEKSGRNQDVFFF